MVENTQVMNENKPVNVVLIDEAQIKSHLSEVVRVTVEETLNRLLDAEADAQLWSQQRPRVIGQGVLSVSRP